MLDEAARKLVVWDRQKTGSAIGTLVLLLEDIEMVLACYKLGAFATETICWPDSMDKHKKANTFVGIALSHVALP